MGVDVLYFQFFDVIDPLAFKVMEQLPDVVGKVINGRIRKALYIEPLFEALLNKPERRVFDG